MVRSKDAVKPDPVSSLLFDEGLELDVGLKTKSDKQHKQLQSGNDVGMNEGLFRQDVKSHELIQIRVGLGENAAVAVSKSYI
jgi:hypothetical protein